MISNTALKTLLFSALLGALPPAAPAQDAPSEETFAYFRQNCMSCHTIGGGRLTGPDLKGATERADEAWLAEFILDPKGVIDSGDPYAADLLRESRGVYMSQIPGLDQALADKLVRLIAAESAKERSEFAGLQISDRPLTQDDVDLGRDLFRGAASYENGAPSCISCHTLAGIGGLGGGRLGPDLTAVYDRLEGRKALSAWLGAPPSLVMQPVFKDHTLESEEILALVAYLKSVAESGDEQTSASILQFLLLGFGGTLSLLVLFDFLWRKRYRASRRPMLRNSRRPAMGSHS